MEGIGRGAGAVCCGSMGLVGPLYAQRMWRGRVSISSSPVWVTRVEKIWVSSSTSSFAGCVG